MLSDTTYDELMPDLLSIIELGDWCKRGDHDACVLIDARSLSVVSPVGGQWQVLTLPLEFAEALPAGSGELILERGTLVLDGKRIGWYGGGPRKLAAFTRDRRSWLRILGAINESQSRHPGPTPGLVFGEPDDKTDTVEIKPRPRPRKR